MSLREDLDNRIYERLTIWVKDSLELYGMAGLGHRKAAQDMFTSLMLLLCKIAVSFRMDPEMVADTVKDTMRKLDDSFNSIITQIKKEIENDE